MVTALGAFMASLDLSIVNVAFPALERTFPHDSRATLAWVITGYSIVFGSLLVVAGRTADRMGRRRVFFAGLAVFSLGSRCAVAPSVDLLIAGRLVQGLGAAAMLPASLGLLLGAFPSERRSQVVALWGGIGALAVATGRRSAPCSSPGRLAVRLLRQSAGRAGGLAARPPGPRRDPGRQRGPRPTTSGSCCSAVRLAALVLAISEGPTWGWIEPGVIGSLGAAVVLASLFLYRSARHAEPVLDLRCSGPVLQRGQRRHLLYAMGFFAMLLGNILFLTSVWHYSILRAGLAVTPGPLVVAAVSGPAGKLAARIGFRPVLLVGFAVLRRGPRLVRDAGRPAPQYLTVWLPGHAGHRARASA